MTGPILTLTAGRLWCRHVRDYLNITSFADPSVHWIETGGLLERTFTIQATQETLEDLARDLRSWIKETS